MKNEQAIFELSRAVGLIKDSIACMSKAMLFTENKKEIGEMIGQAQALIKQIQQGTRGDI